MFKLYFRMFFYLCLAPYGEFSLTKHRTKHEKWWKNVETFFFFTFALTQTESRVSNRFIYRRVGKSIASSIVFTRWITYFFNLSQFSLQYTFYRTNLDVISNTKYYDINLIHNLPLRSSLPVLYIHEQFMMQSGQI